MTTTNELDLPGDWTDIGGTVADPDQLLQFVSQLRADLSNMATGLYRAAAGALSGHAWLETPADGSLRPSIADTRSALDMTAPPPGMPAKDATHRQALAGLLAVLEAADVAALTAWLACVNAADPDRRA